MADEPYWVLLWRVKDSNLRSFRDGFTVRSHWPLGQPARVSQSRTTRKTYKPTQGRGAAGWGSRPDPVGSPLEEEIPGQPAVRRRQQDRPPGGRPRPQPGRQGERYDADPGAQWVHMIDTRAPSSRSEPTPGAWTTGRRTSLSEDSGSSSPGCGDRIRPARLVVVTLPPS